MSAIFGETLRFSQADGPDVELVVEGDEFYSRCETKTGYTVVYDSGLGKYCYAVHLNGALVSSGAPITKNPPAGLRKHLKESREVRNRKFTNRYNLLRPREPAGMSGRMRTFGVNSGLLEGRTVSVGRVRGLTILVEFADIRTEIDASDVEAMLNGENYHANNNVCSVREYFKRMSSGKLDYTNRVVGPIRLDRNRAYYRNTLLVEEALDKAVREEGVELAEFDSRNDGVVDALNFMYAGRSQTDVDNELWPHNSVATFRYGGVRTHYYMLTSLGRRRVDLSIGTFCHENGHQLCRFPDLYDYGERDEDYEASRGMGVYCLMGAGNRLNRGRAPSPVCAYLRDLAGWCDRATTLNGPGVHEARHGDYDRIMKFDTDRMNEYFLIENRSRLGLDAHLYSSGLAVYHCDTLGSNEWQDGTRNKHYQCALLQADGHLDLENNRNYGDEGDMFNRADGVALSYDTRPSSREWDGSDSALILSDIGAPGEVIRFSVGEQEDAARGHAAPDLLIPDDEPEGVSSAIHLAPNGNAKRISVGVDIIHTYIGDLRIELEAPSGLKALLKKKTNDSNQDLKATYTSDAVSTLADLVGEGVPGPWTLHIKDLARRDTGRLNRWEIEISYESSDRIVEAEAAPGASIPDSDDRGVANVIAIAEPGVLRKMEIAVDIPHTYIGDLIVDVVAPSGQGAVLHNQTGGGANDLKRTYDHSTTPALDALIGQEIKGDWTLRVRDLAADDIGEIKRWSIKLIC